jgi:hypothetical protein
MPTEISRLAVLIKQIALQRHSFGGAFESQFRPSLPQRPRWQPKPVACRFADYG